jgi:hypothetical protein
MAITLRTEKGTALTYAEMDKNFSSFFYSASVDYTNDLLQLWYTGSADLSTLGEDFSPGRVINIPLNPTDNAVTAVAVAGGAGQVQFRDYNNSILAASSNFIYNSTGNLGIGTPSPDTRLHVRGGKTIPATLRLQSGPFNNNPVSYISSIEFYENGALKGEIGRLSAGNNDIYINTAPGGNLKFKVQGDLNTGAWTDTGLGIGTPLPERKLHVVGEGWITDNLGVGTLANGNRLYVYDSIGAGTPTNSHKTYAKFAISGGEDNVVGLNILSLRKSPGNTFSSLATRIQQVVDNTYMGYVEFGGPGNSNGISIGTGISEEDAFGNIHEPGHPDIQERLRITAAGRVGINTIDPERILDVAGDTIVRGIFSSSLHVDVGLSLEVGTSAEVGTTLKVGSTATILDVPQNNEANPRMLIQSQTGTVGQVQYVTGSIIPRGGIIMWSGVMHAWPAGWKLCDGNNVGNNTGIVIPDLRERFIVGAGGDNEGVVSKNYATAQFDLQPNTFLGNGTVSLPLNSLANGIYNVVTTGVYHHIPGSTIVQGAIGGAEYGERFFVYQKTGSNPYYLIYSTMVSNYILVRGTFPGAGSIPNFQQAPSATSTTSGHYFYQPIATTRGVADYGREVNGTWVNYGKRPDHLGFYYYDTLGYSIGDRGGNNEVTLEVAQIPPHTHKNTTGGLIKSNGVPNYDSGYNNAGTTTSTGGYLPHENRPPYYALAFLIYTGGA